MDNQQFERFELYLSEKLSSQERLEFEAQLAADPDMRRDFEIYSVIENTMRVDHKKGTNDALNSTLNSLSNKYFTDDSIKSDNIIPINSRPTVKIIGWLAAASVLFIAVYFIFIQKPNVEQLAEAYYNSNLMRISQTLGTSDDSLQLGISAYNKKDYTTAATYFSEIQKTNPNHVDAARYLGLTYLAQENYNQALAIFDSLSNVKTIHSNPGVFLKAITLLKRDAPGDSETARSLLKTVVDQKLEGAKEARKWLSQ